MSMDTKEPLATKDFIILGLYLGSFVILVTGYIYLSRLGFNYLSETGEKNAITYLTGNNVYFRIVYSVTAIFLPVLSVYGYIKFSMRNDYKSELKKLNETLQKKKIDAYGEILVFSQDLVRYSEYEKLENDLLPLIKQICNQNMKSEYEKIAVLVNEIKEIKPSYNPKNARASYFDHQTISKKQYKLAKLIENLKHQLVYI